MPTPSDAAVRPAAAPLSREALDALAPGDVDALAALDAQGLLLAPGEELSAFKARVAALLDDLDAVRAEAASPSGLELLPGVRVGGQDAIAPAAMDEAGDVTAAAYAFRAGWIPGFYLSRSLGWLWGGCAMAFDSGLPLFIVRRDFAAAPRWLWYGRRELLAHELCHAVRAPLRDSPYEELFAYRPSPSRLRRAIGNWFQRRADAVLLLLPILLLLSAQAAGTFAWPRMPTWPFWLLAAAWPAFLALRDLRARARLARAARNVRPAASNAYALLFRCATPEIAALAAARSPAEAEAWMRARARESPRWAVLEHRFLRRPDGAPPAPADGA